MIHLLYVYFFYFFICQRKLYLLKKKKGNNKYLLYKSKYFSFFPKMENMNIYAGATEETSVFDVETSEPSSTCLPKSCMMHVRNCLFMKT